MAADVYYLASGGARAAAVVAAHAAFTRLPADRIALVPHVELERQHDCLRWVLNWLFCAARLL